MQNWPSSLLPDWQRGYTVTPVDNVVTTTFAAGNTRQRVLGVNNQDVVSVRLLLDEQQLRLFEYFVKEKLNKVDWFGGRYPQANTLVEGVIQLVAGRYSVKQLSNADLYEITAAVRVQNRVDAEADVLNLMLVVAPNSLDELIDTTEQAVNDRNSFGV